MARFFEIFILMRPSCGTRRSAMSSRDMTFRRAASLIASCTGGCGHFLQHAVEAEADAVGALVGLEMDVRRAAPDGVEHDLVDEADDRRVLDVGRDRRRRPRPRRRRR